MTSAAQINGKETVALLDPPAAKIASQCNTWPTVDVVIPCYKYAHYLRGCVESVVRQRDVHVRVLVIDDASPDDTAEIGRALAAEYPQVEFRRHITNAGHIATYNEGLIHWSESEYCMLLSADDLLAPGALSRAVRIMERDPKIGMVYGEAIHFFEEHALPKREIRSKGVVRYSGADWIARRCRAAYNVITSPEVVIRSSVQRSVGGYRHELPHSGDLEMWLRIAAVADIAYVRAPQAFYRVHPSSMQRTQFQGQMVDMVERRAAFRSFFQFALNPFAGRHSLEEDAFRALAREALWDACRLYDHDRAELERVETLVSFAGETWPKAQTLPEFAALRRRQRLGAAFCHHTQLFVVPAALQWARRRFLEQRRRYLGV
jgi:glycosyltransferase involved in cell wall biosynthesis